METCIAIHHNGQSTRFTYLETVESARVHLAELIKSHQVGYDDTLSIVRVEDDHTIYYKRRNNTLDSVLGNRRAATQTVSDWYEYTQWMLSKMYRKLTFHS